MHLLFIMYGVQAAVLSLFAANPPAIAALYDYESNIHKSILEYLSRNTSTNGIPPVYLARYEQSRAFRELICAYVHSGTLVNEKYLLLDVTLPDELLLKMILQSPSSIGHHFIFNCNAYLLRFTKNNPRNPILKCVNEFLVILNNVKHRKYQSADELHADYNKFMENASSISLGNPTLDYLCKWKITFTKSVLLASELVNFDNYIDNYNPKVVYLCVCPYHNDAISMLDIIAKIKHDANIKYKLIIISDTYGYEKYFKAMGLFEDVIKIESIDGNLSQYLTLHRSTVLYEENGVPIIAELCRDSLRSALIAIKAKSKAKDEK